MNQPATLLAGDTLFLRGGIYLGNFTTQLTGGGNNYIVVYPNPTQHQCFIALPKGTDTPVQASVYAMNGQVVWQMSDLAVSESRIALNLSSLETGMYVLVLEGDSGKYYSRIEITGE